ncbi:DMT family transporter [Agarivorans sp.]|uniref:DMT family transporter n=1 Tax=Agarivorans sp. TaxID=1872412 RepID=UPI003D03E66F
MAEGIKLKPLLSTVLALLAFAANSLLCRLALGEQQIDAASFTGVRLLSGALTLALLLRCSQGRLPRLRRAKLGSALMLFVYASCFSFAYVYLDTGIGALILFGAVQLSMLLISWWKGAPLKPAELLGVICAFSGLVLLLAPSEQFSLSIIGFVLMLVAGIAWGIYSLVGRTSTSPSGDTYINFCLSLPWLVLLLPWLLKDGQFTALGVVLAAASGAVASGLGYWLWYVALASLSASQAAVLQLLVPIIAAAGGWWLLDEALGWRFLFSACLVLGGILLTIFSRQRH